FDGIFNGMSVVNYVKDVVKNRATSLPAATFEKYVQQEEGKVKKLMESTGDENPYLIHRTLGDEMTAACTVVRSEDRMLKAAKVMADLKQRYKKVRLSDTG